MQFFLKEEFREPAPDFVPSSKTFTIEDPNITTIFSILLDNKNNGNQVNIEQLLWCANGSINELGDFAKPVYSFLIEKGLSAFIPIDNKEMVLDW